MVREPSKEGSHQPQIIRGYEFMIGQVGIER